MGLFCHPLALNCLKPYKMADDISGLEDRTNRLWLCVHFLFFFNPQSLRSDMEYARFDGATVF